MQELEKTTHLLHLQCIDDADRDDGDGVHADEEQKCEEISVIPSSNAIIQPRAVVIEALK
jgi:hypothetical protein